MTTWLVGHDFSPCARTAAHEAAKDLSARGGGKLVLAHAWQSPSVPKGFDLSTYRDAIETDANYQLTQMGEEIEGEYDNIEVEKRIVEGRAEDVLLGLADKVSASRLIVGTHSRSEIEAEFLGSVAQRVMRSAAVPVLVVKAMQALPPA